MANGTMDAFRVLREAETALDDVARPLTETLFQAIGGLDDKKLRTALLKVKRQVHNLRPPDAAALETIRDAAPDLGGQLDRYADLFRRTVEARSLFDDTFEAEVGDVRRRFRDLVLAEDFRKGLLLGSRTLFDATERYLRTPVRGMDAKARQIERSLMRYYSRTAAKTTPFSTFCALLPGRFQPPDDGSAAPGFTDDPGQKRSAIRLNKLLFKILVRGLLRRPAIRRHLAVELNPTMSRDDGRWVFLSEVDKLEVFQRLAPSPVVELIREILAEKHHLPLAGLVAELLEEVEASEDDVLAYVDRLLEAGFLRFLLGIREQEVDWTAPLSELLAPVRDEHAERTVDFLATVEEKNQTYANAPPEERRTLLGELSSLVTAHCESLEGEERWPSDKGVLYEDAGSSASLALDLGDLRELLIEWVDLTSPFVWNRGEQANMRHFFSSYYGPDATSVPLLRFYEDYYREHFKEHLERQRQGDASRRAAPDDQDGEEEQPEPRAPEDLSNPFGLELVGKLDAARKRLDERLRELWRADPAAEEIVLERRDLEASTAGLPTLTEPCRSTSLFVQYVPGFSAAKDALVCSSYLPGFGKYFSRFLYLLPGEVEQALVAGNERHTRADLAEICGDATLNADLHPPLLPREIGYPTTEGGHTEDQLRISDLNVEGDPERPFRLLLRHGPTGREVLPVDLGFLNPRMRPALFQLLSRLSPAGGFFLNVPQLPEEPKADATGGMVRASGATGGETPETVLYRPRVTYHGRLILARRQWTFPRSLFPERSSGETEAPYFLRIQRWREEHGLPEEVFVRIRPRPSQETSDEAKKPDPAKDDEKAETEKPKTEKPETRRLRQHVYKPQYVDFRNPLLVDLFSRMEENLENFQFVLEERLPGRDQLLAKDGERYVTEFVVQVDFPERT